ncbi:MAG: Ig domain-containing protein [Clostridiales bacterium]|nr:Ig domain-containing protein [Clostridiales bacterium]
MSMRKCPDCGEMYSTSYKNCPFCEEEENYNKPKNKVRSGHRVASRKTPSILGPALILVLVLLVVFLVYFFFGDKIGGLFKKDTETTPPTTQTDDTQTPASDLKISATTASMVVGDTQMLSVEGSDGTTYTWQSSDETVATVDNGVVTAVAEGKAIITVSGGGASAACAVTVGAKQTEETPQTETPQQPATPAENLTLETIYGTKDDISMGVGDSVEMEVAGTSAAVTWSIADAGVATVNGSGVVTGVTTGKTTLTATVNGTSLSCIIRVG